VPFKRRLIRNTGPAFLCATLLTLAQAQKQTNTHLSNSSIEVSSVTFRLGMTKAQVKDKLAQGEITKLDDDTWVLGSPGKGGPLLQFNHGLLSYAEREWTNPHNDVAEALFAAVAAINKEGLNKCTVTATTQIHEIGWKFDRVWMVCGEKTIALMRNSSGKVMYDSVWERLGTFRKIER